MNIDSNSKDSPACASFGRMLRRRWLHSALVGGGLLQTGMLTRVAESIARAQESSSGRSRPRAMILLWMQGGPSQLETFDPHPGTMIGGEVRSLSTSLAGVSIADTLPRTAELMHRATLVRSMVSKEGDHERATYNMKTGWRPDPTLVHPSIGAVLCHQTASNIEIPRHVSILAGQWSSRGGYLGSSLDAFRLGDPKDPLPNLKSYVAPEIFQERISDLEQIESRFRRGRMKDLDDNKTLQALSTERAKTMMASHQIQAFEIDREPQAVRDAFGDTPFGRGCLAAARLIEQGVTCVEVELSGWDSHVENHALQSGRCKILDAAIHGLVNLLIDRDLFDSTVVMCGGEFGRTPKINVADGRDHWPTGFSTVLFGGPFRRGYVHGETTSKPIDEGKEPLDGVKDPVRVEDLHATLLHGFGIDFAEEMMTPIGRPLAHSQGAVISHLLSDT
ncbi:MAG: DUF1501 domain-containing protein [Planctomycetota bacterium]|jgi:hypothetical protein